MVGVTLLRRCYVCYRSWQLREKPLILGVLQRTLPRFFVCT